MESLEATVGRLLRERHLTLATAESCTGGLISHRLTNVPGSSAYFLAGFVTYGNKAKESVLGVHRGTMEQHGAVSPETAGEMARGARRVAGADLAVAVTGIAGPEGGGPGKPVGLVYLAIDGGRGTEIAKCIFQGDRTTVKEKAAEEALAMLSRALRDVR